MIFSKWWEYVTPSYYYWIWDKDQRRFVEDAQLEALDGAATFDYKNEEIRVQGRAGASYHEFSTYRYIDGKLTLVKKIVDQDNDGKRRVYELIDGKLKLVETTKTQLK